MEGTENEESEIRLAQLQHQLPSNEPGALMHLVQDVESENEDDQDTMECKKLFRNMKFFLSREVSKCTTLGCHLFRLVIVGTTLIGTGICQCGWIQSSHLLPLRLWMGLV